MADALRGRLLDLPQLRLDERLAIAEQRRRHLQTRGLHASQQRQQRQLHVVICGVDAFRRPLRQRVLYVSRSLRVRGSRRSRGAAAAPSSRDPPASTRRG